MKILYQWALRNPTDWQEIDSSQWASLPKRPLPNSGQLGGLSNVPGWVRNVNVQGITNEGFDHVAIEEITIGNDVGVKMTSWNDDPDDFPVGERQAIVWTILPLAPDPKLGMAINTRQSCVRYCEGARYERFTVTGHPPLNTTIRPWTEFIAPAEAITRHGVLLENTKFQEHVNIAPQSKWGWMHWNEHLSDSETELDARGRRVLKEQRAQGRYKQAEHTITYYQRGTDVAIAGIAATNENTLALTTTGAVTESVTLDTNTINTHAFCTDAGQPNSADWPNGDFHSQVNCTAASTGVVYGNAGFHRFSSTTSLLASIVPGNGSGDSNDFSGTGLKLSTATGDFAAGAADNRFGFHNRATGDSMSDAITLQLNTTDSYADGPWTVGGTSLIKTVNGLAIASVKTVNGLAIASVKTINGLTNV